jgi:hypothetical protein
MSLYFFHLRDGQDVLLDPDGRELDSLEAVQRIALEDARMLISADALEGVIDLACHLDVEDASGKVVYSLDFEDAVQILRKGDAQPAPERRGD